MDLIQDFRKFLEEMHTELAHRIKTVDEALIDMKAVSSDTDELEKLLEITVGKAEDVNESMKLFKNNLVERNLIKDCIPPIHLLTVGDRKRDSGFASSISSASPATSYGRLSGADYETSEAKSEVNFNLMSTNTSRASLTDLDSKNAEVDGTDERVENQSDISTLYIHLLPTDPYTDLSALREKIYNISRSTVKSDKIEIHVVPSNSFIGVTTRQTSISSDGDVSVLRQISSSSERLNFVRNRLPSSNDSLQLLNRRSVKIPTEHSESSDESRHVSSSDSEVSVGRLRQQRTTTEAETQTIDTGGDNSRAENPSPRTLQQSVYTQTN